MTRIVDNFLGADYFNRLQTLITNEDFPWYYNGRINGEQDKDDNGFYMTHLLYTPDGINSDYFNEFISVFEHVGIKSIKHLMRVKLNMYPGTDSLKVNAPHVDFKEPHKGFILYFNTCDGYTVLPDQKVESVANRGLYFDSSKPHSSTTCTNAKARFNININYK